VALPRSREEEILDRPGLAEADLEGALRDIARVNRWLGGRRSTAAALEELLGPEPPARLSILDAGCGGADLSRHLVRWGERRGLRVRVLALDLDPGICRIARRWSRGCRDVLPVRGDARALPLADGSVDVAVAAMFTHHFDEEGVAALLREFDRVARRGVLVNDLRRSRFSALGISLLARLGGAHPMFRHDAPLSVRRGFLPAELREIAGRAGLEGRASLRSAWAGRLVLTLRPGEAAP
jgi:SAM-dependent methyltransferase